LRGAIFRIPAACFLHSADIQLGFADLPVRVDLPLLPRFASAALVPLLVAASQPWIVKDKRSGLLTRIAAMESISLCAQRKAHRVF
jgi:hypothetical protein